MQALGCVIPALHQPGLSGDIHRGIALAERRYIDAGLKMW